MQISDEMEAMVIDEVFISSLVRKAGEASRLRMAVDLRNSEEDGSQRILNVLVPGTQVPVHRHLSSNETTIILSGKLTVVFYDAEGIETERFQLCREFGRYGIQIPKGQWHGVIVDEPCAVIEVKDGAYRPFTEDEILTI